jgi:putative ABC transport system permease protein
MLKSYLLVALRNLMKRKLYSFINIFGLAVGVAVCLVILKYVDFELSYDSYHTNAENIYRTTTTAWRQGELRGTSVLSGYAQGPALLADLPEVKRVVRTHPMYGGAVITYARPSADGDPSTFYEEGIQIVDSTFLDVFSYQAVQGNLETALDNPASIVMTREMANRYFKPGEDPIGKVMKIAGGWFDGEFEVTAIIENVPGNSHFLFDFLLPMHKLLKNGQYTNDDGWGWNNFITYVELHEKTTPDQVTGKLEAFIEKYRGKRLKEINGKDQLSFQPIRAIHLNPGMNHESSSTVSVNVIYFFIVISIFIMAIAWVNYINLSTARAMERAREVGIKKAVGVFRSQLISQFLMESVLVNFIGVVIALVLAMLLLPVLGDIVGKQFSFDFTDVRLYAIMGGLFLLGSFVSGAYPAFVLSSFRVTEVLKGKSERAVGGFSLRKGLVVFQFASSLILIAGTFAIYRQLMYMRSQDKGLTMEQMLIVNGPAVLENSTRRQQLTSAKNEMKNIPGVTAVATSAAIPGGGYNWGGNFRKVGAPVEDNKAGSVVWIDPDFVETYDLEIIAGKSFDITIKSSMEGCLVNEAALKVYGLGTPEQALNERLLLGDTTEIIGVVKNFHWNSLKTDHTPFMFKADTISGKAFSLHLSSNNMSQTVAQVEAKYKELFPGNPFNYYFLDDFFDTQYKDDQQFGKIFSLFAGLAILIACLGLWGLASFTTSQKLKEIGIRKVLGASVGSIMSLLSWQFLKLVLIASVIGLPLTWYGISEWLGGFAFRINLGWDLLVVPVVILTVIALGTVSLQILKGASINPARVLRSE